MIGCLSNNRIVIHLKNANACIYRRKWFKPGIEVHFKNGKTLFMVCETKAKAFSILKQIYDFQNAK